MDDQDHSARFPSWRAAMNQTQLLEVRDESWLDFISTVVAQGITKSVVDVDEQVGNWRIKTLAAPRIALYLNGDEVPLLLLYRRLRKALLGLDSQASSAVECHRLHNGACITILNPSFIAAVTEQDIAVAEAATGLVVVAGSACMDVSAPNLALEASIDPNKRSTKRKPYVLDLLIQERGLAGWTTHLLPKYWSLHPAYSIVRDARQAKATQLR